MRAYNLKKIAALANKDVCHQNFGLQRLRGNKKRCVGQIVLKPWHVNLAHTIHGGILYSAIDTVMGLAAVAHLAGSETILAMDVKINYIRPAFLKMKRLQCSAELVSRTGRFAVVEGVVSFPKREILAKAMGTYAILRRSPTEKASWQCY